MTLSAYLILCVIWIGYIFKTRNKPANAVEFILSWTVFIPVTMVIMIVALIALVIEMIKEEM